MTRSHQSERDVQIIALYEAGMAPRDIGREFLVTKNRIHQILTRHKIPRRTISEAMVLKWAWRREKR